MALQAEWNVPRPMALLPSPGLLPMAQVVPAPPGLAPADFFQRLTDAILNRLR